MEELKPCPFCGKEPKRFRNRAGGLVICCNSLQCELLSIDGESESEADDEELIAAWNTRADYALTERVRVLEECLGSLMSFIDKGMLVRDVSRDYEQGWHLKMLPLVQALSKARALLAQPAQSGDTDTQADAS